MKIRLVSDLHVDVNEISDFGFLNEKQDILLIAGDTAGSSEEEINFLEKIPSKCICIGGNHLGYDYTKTRSLNAVLGINNPTQCTKEDCIKTLTTYNFDNVSYLENQYIEIDNYIIFAGTMYSDFLLYGKPHRDNCKWTSERWLNDFRYVYTHEKSKKIVRPVTADDYIKWNKKFMKELNKCIKETTKDIIVVTHFAPSVRSISNEYLNRPNRLSSPGSELNAVYANNMEDFIKDNPRIKLWCHGHCHSNFDYNIKQCRVICCPFGYIHENDILPELYVGMEIDL